MSHHLLHVALSRQWPDLASVSTVRTRSPSADGLPGWSPLCSRSCYALPAGLEDTETGGVVDLDALAAELEGYCAALILKAALTAMRESLEATEVTAAQLTAARQTVRPSLDSVQLAELAGYAAARGPGLS